MKKFILFLLLTVSISAYATDIPYSFQTATQREDGTALGLSEIKGHNLYWGSVIGDYQNTIFFPGAKLPETSITISEYITFEDDAKALPKSPTIPRGQVIKATSTLP